MRHAMIMAGGSGTRLWPMSRLARPKQLLPLVGERSLLELAVDRLDGVVPAEHRIICTAEKFRDTITEVIKGVELLGEPCGRDTLNAVGLTAAILALRDPDAAFAVLTADHIIEPQATFARAMEVGFQLVERDPRRFVTFGITPTFPATGYGYVGLGAAIDGFDGAFAAATFKEKPDLETARAYLEAGTFNWNSGMFIFSAATTLEAIKRFQPEAHEGLMRIAEAWNGADRQSVLETVYPTLPKISVDYGLMEPVAANADYEVCVVPMDVDWRDVGSWSSYAETIDPDQDGNRVHGEANLRDCSNVLAVSDDPKRVVTAIGCEDLMIIATGDAILVVPSDRSEEVKQMADAVPESHR
ncbi:MAG: mannose-1-phosphate guanylyltransferase [Phycisphaerales bacterium]|nr:mannose-1-phosphate guanylyltransferase [Phycisphaerales bacterium]